MANLVSYSSSSSCNSGSEEEDEASGKYPPSDKQADSCSDNSLLSPPAKKPRGNSFPSPEALSLPPAILAMFNDSVGMYRVLKSV